jgi:FkbM family methyltransferase
MTNYSQNNEQLYIERYFGDFVGTLLDIGANDGKTFSNSLGLIEKGWRAFLVEPSPTAFAKLEELHYENENVDYLNAAVGTENKVADYFDMGQHINQGDSSLLSTLVANEMKRWAGTSFIQRRVDMITYERMCDKFQEDTFDFITIDAEGMDIAILKQIDLTHVRCLCIEYNNNLGDLGLIRSIVPVQFKEIHRNLENVIYAR